MYDRELERLHAIQQETNRNLRQACKDNVVYAREAKRQSSVLLNAQRSLKEAEHSYQNAATELLALEVTVSRSRGRDRPAQSKLANARRKSNKAHRKLLERQGLVRLAEAAYNEAVTQRDAAVNLVRSSKVTKQRTSALVAKRIEQRAIEDEICLALDVPEKYWGTITFKCDEYENIHLYFNNDGDKQLHAHYVISSDGKVLYRTEVGQPRGKQNYTAEGYAIFAKRKRQAEQNSNVS